MDSLSAANRLAEKNRFIDTADELDVAVSEMADASALSIDTEFMRERTYYPELCLIQVADGRNSWCIDTLKIDDIGIFLELCRNNDIPKVLHSARQDLEIFYLLMNAVPMPIFDTQLAASFTGRAEQISYAGLVEDILGVALDKSQSRTNWAARPLRAAQISYALNDVIYLQSLRQKLSEELSSKGRAEWFNEDSKTLGDSKIYVVEPADAWQKVKGAGNLELEAFRRAVALADWRERVAQAKNLPRAWVLKDAALIAIAEEPDADLHNFQRNGVLTAKQLKRWGAELENVLTSSLPDIDLPPYHGARGLDRQQKDLFKRISAVVKGAAVELGINSTLLANRKEMEKLARGAADSPMFYGWREEVFGREVRELLDT